LIQRGAAAADIPAIDRARDPVMSSPHRTFFRRFGASVATAALGLALAACGGGGSSSAAPDSSAAAAPDTHSAGLTGVSPPATDPAPAPRNKLSTGLKLPGYPHAIDILEPASGATRIIVFLHGTRAHNFTLENQLGLNAIGAQPTATSVNWDWLAKNKVIAVFPQGQALPASPNLTTWSNTRADSGQDDVAFLVALSSYLKQTYGIDDVSLVGHSAGGMMASRMWCEATTSYTAYVSLSATAPIQYLQPGTPCSPSAAAPYLVVLGAHDSAIEGIVAGNGWTPTADETAAGLANSALANEVTQHHNRSWLSCGESPSLLTRVDDSAGATWSNCAGHTVYRLLAQADHQIASLETYAGSKMIDVIAGFIAR